MGTAFRARQPNGSPTRMGGPYPQANREGAKYRTLHEIAKGELLEIAMQHAVAVHAHKDTPEGRNQLRKLIKDGNPPETVQAR